MHATRFIRADGDCRIAARQPRAAGQQSRCCRPAQSTGPVRRGYHLHPLVPTSASQFSIWMKSLPTPQPACGQGAGVQWSRQLFNRLRREHRSRRRQRQRSACYRCGAQATAEPGPSLEAWCNQRGMPAHPLAGQRRQRRRRRRRRRPTSAILSSMNFTMGLRSAALSTICWQWSALVPSHAALPSAGSCGGPGGCAACCCCCCRSGCAAMLPGERATPWSRARQVLSSVGQRLRGPEGVGKICRSAETAVARQWLQVGASGGRRQRGRCAAGERCSQV